MTPRTVLITGASTGIGRALALELARRGANVALSARRADMLESLADEVRALGREAHVLPCDVADVVATKALVVDAERALGSLDMVIANAGVGATSHATRLDIDDLVRTCDVNVRGALVTLAAAIPIMLHQGRGHLVGVSSLAGRRALPTSGAYNASKAALSVFLETLRIDLVKTKIAVTDVQPGFVATPMTEKNRHPMPFMWPVDKAASVITDRLERAPAVIAFPWPLDWVTRLARILPGGFYRWVTSRML